MVDSSKRKEESGLKHPDEKTYSFYLTSRNPAFITNKKGELIDVNESFSKKLGFTKEEIVGVSLQEASFLTEEARKQAMYRHITKLIGKETPFYSLDVQTPKGDILSLDVDTKPYIKNGKLIGEFNFVRKASAFTPAKKKKSQAEKLEEESKSESRDLLKVLDKAKEKNYEIRQMQTELEKKYADLDLQKREFQQITQKWVGSQAELEEKNHEIRRLQAELESRQQQAEIQQREINDLRKKVRERQIETEEKSDEISILKRDVDKKQSEIKSKKEDIRVKTSELEDARSALEDNQTELEGRLQEIKKLRNEVENQQEEHYCRVLQFQANFLNIHLVRYPCSE